MPICLALAVCSLLPSAPLPAAQEAPSLLRFDVVGRKDTDGPRPVLLALPPGAQNRAMVDAGHRLYWKDAAEKNGWTVIAPLAPEGELLRGDNIPRVMELVDHIEKTYEVEYGRVHLAGVSNGGRTAMDLARRDAARFASLSLAPGMPEEITEEGLGAIRSLPLAMYVGGDDKGWLEPMEEIARGLTKLGSPPARFTVFDGEGHTPESLSGATLFHTLETFRIQAALEDFHGAASKADGPRYFRHFHPSAIYMGTDASERWTLPQFQGFVDPYFSKGRGWTYVARSRFAYVSPDGQAGWFDEMLDNDAYGLTRGTGVFLRTDAGWKMTQYHLTIPVPNDLARTLVDLIRKEEQAK